MVTPLKSHPQAVPRTLAEGYWGGGSGHGHGQKKGQNRSLFLVKMMFVELFCEVLYDERPHFDLAVLLWRWCILRNNLRTVREVRHVCHCELCAPAPSFPCFIKSVIPVSRGQIGVLCAKSFCERIFLEANDVCHDRNTLLDTEEINMLVVLRINRQFIHYMREIYPKLSGPNFKITFR